MIKNTKPSRYYAWVLKSKTHMQGFTDWLVDNGFCVLTKEKFNRGEFIAFIGKGGRGSLYETGYANEQCIKAITKYLRSVK